MQSPFWWTFFALLELHCRRGHYLPWRVSYAWCNVMVALLDGQTRIEHWRWAVPTSSNKWNEPIELVYGNAGVYIQIIQHISLKQTFATFARLAITCTDTRTRPNCIAFAWLGCPLPSTRHHSVNITTITSNTVKSESIVVHLNKHRLSQLIVH